MSDTSETGGRPLASTQQQLEGSIQQHQPSLARTKRRKTSQSSDERVGGTKSTQTRRRPGTRKEASSFGPQPRAGSSRGDSSTMQRSTSPRNLSPEVPTVNYTRTGRISKAKKGLKVHHCECGRSYTRAEHLRRHQKNHAQDDALVCQVPGCGKTFYRPDLLQRHQERHNEMGKDSPVFSPSSAVGQEPIPMSDSIPTSGVTPESQWHTPQAIPTTRPVQSAELRYTSNPFRTPQIPSSAFGHVLRSSPRSKSSPNSKQRGTSYPGSRSAVNLVAVGPNGLDTNITWSEPFSHSPNYSSSSGYASPIPGASDYPMFPNAPYGPGSNRTRTSSNASFIEPWGYPSRSPTSATSTMAYTWTSNDKSPASSLAYMHASYPMTSVPMAAGTDPMSGYGHFGPKTLAQRDEEEQAFLFPEQSYGMGQIAHTYPFEQYLDNYWRLFHPAFPVVHRTTFDGMNESPMLHAAMIAVGGQYSNDASVKRKSRILHDRCMKLLDQRDLNVVTEPDRLCDYQALFLIEVLSQYRARRAAKTLSTRFESLYQKLCENFQFVTSNTVDIVSSVVQEQPENATYKQWSQWISDSVHQRLLLCCYILEYQQTTLLGRSPQQSLIQYSGFDLPFPTHSTLWDATNPSDWAIAAQQYGHLPTYVYEIHPHITSGPFEAFQSSLLIAAHYNHFSNPTPYLAPPAFPTIDHLLDASPITKHNLLTAKLLQVTPIRSLLAISGESWILSEKVPSPQAFLSYKSTLRTWLGALWASTSEQSQPCKEALKLSIEILQQAMIAPAHSLRLELGADMGLYFAALVVWAVTVASNSRINGSSSQVQQQRYQTHSPLPTSSARTSSSHYPSTPTSTHLSFPGSASATSPNPNHPANLGLANPRSSPAATSTSTSNNANSSTMLSHSEITLTSMSFLSSALLELDLLGIVPQWPRDVLQWQQGCAALMRWVKMRLRSGAGPDGLEARDSVIGLGMTGVGGPTITLGANGSGRGGDGLGELLDGVIGTLEKIMSRGWDGWGV